AEGGHESVRLFDFGIARALGRTARSTLLTVIDHSLGTPAFIAPELIEGSGNDDSRADLYALGVLIYYLLSGRPPFGGRSAAEVVDQQLHRQAPRLPPSAGLESLVARLLEKRPLDRPASADVVVSVLEEILSARIDREPLPADDPTGPPSE